MSPVLSINGSVLTLKEVSDGRKQFHYCNVASFLFSDLLGRGGTLDVG
jgi:hypothetical protein